ncbi:hypothetical protein GTO89_13235 [Heliobacterium gestii]|uniref:Uncharacterized protein n=1 Tax=Heliomicrobium gestii TaxID=2699 RepID=A0A845LM89_HELGE|nr:DUF4911 domain-containing protein [Heliomicrobium gestii]MBM7867602.1 hypothetical protein [Heliomicrobium gestii]MZP43996.1 hypothetical protein [Heliomicrobium gestii]
MKSNRYKGNRRLSRWVEEIAATERVAFIRFADGQASGLGLRLLEGYAHLLYVVALEPAQGWYAVHATPECWTELPAILRSLPRPPVEIRYSR